MFCPECGRSDIELIEGICIDCFLKEYQFLSIPENITVTVCKHCNAKLDQGRWKDEEIPDEEIIYRTLEQNIKIDDLAEDEEIELTIDQMRGTIAECYVEGVATVLGRQISESHTPNIKIKHSVCPDCSKKSSGYYEAVIQLRADERDINDEEMSIAENIISRTIAKQVKKDKLAYIPQIATPKEGKDYYIGSLKTARKIVERLKEEFGGEIKESPRIVTEDKNTGKGIYRIWISLRIPKIQTNDFIKFQDKTAKITAINGNRIQILNLEDYTESSLKWRDYESIEKIADEKNLLKGIISSKSPNVIQILDPEDYSPIDLQMNERFQNYNIGDEVDVLKLEGKIFLV